MEAQQEEASRHRARTPVPSSEQLLEREKRRTLELARTRAAEDLTRARSAPHRRMLEQALEELERQLRALGGL